MKKWLLLVLVIVLFSGTTTEAVNWPLRVSANGPYLEDQDGVPFLVVGDAAWSAAVRLNHADLATYLDDRKNKGFTTLVINAIEHKYAARPPANYNGDVPFTNGINNWSVRNEAYWANVDYVVNQAKSRGMLVLFFPAYLGYLCGDQGWCANMLAQTDASMTNYGTWIGNRYKNQGNIIWVHGGDAAAASYGALNKVNAIANAVAATNTSYLHTAHSGRERSALDDYNQPWLDLNSTYSDCDTCTGRIHTDYQRSGELPDVFIEGKYDNGASTYDMCVQSQMLDAFLGGALLGQIYGNENVWKFSTGWKGASGIGAPMSTSIGNIGKLMRSRDWWKLVPDYDNIVVTSSKVAGSTYKATARTSDGATVMIWNPTAANVTVNMTKVNGANANVWLWVPGNNSATFKGSYATTGTMTFTPQAGTVLVLDDASKGFGAPGAQSVLLKAAPASLDFGAVPVGKTSAAKEISITNTGTTGFVITSLGVTGTGSTMFEVSPGGAHPCSGVALSPGANCTVVASFAPGSEGEESSVLMIGVNGVVPPEGQIPLSGAGSINPVTVSAPNGGEVWETMSTHTIEWVSSSKAAAFNVTYSLNGGASWALIGTKTVTGSSVAWHIPAVTKNSAKSLIRVIAYDAKNRKIGIDKSDGPFTVEVLTVTAPENGDTCYSGNTCQISWTKADGLNFSQGGLYYSLNGGLSWKKIQAVVSGTDTGYSWVTPDVTKITSKGKIKLNLHDAKGKVIGTSMSDGYFTISP